MIARLSLSCALIMSFTLGVLTACSPADMPSTPSFPDSPTPDVQVLPPTATPHALPTATRTAPPSPLPTVPPPEETYVPIGEVENTALLHSMRLKGNTFSLEIADTPDERALGLMHREFLPRDAGMLFVFQYESTRAFWMKNTLIPLDILYMDSDGIVVDIQTMHPQPGVQDGELRTYPSAAPAQYALEINAGLAAEYGFAVGDQALFR